MFSEIGVTITTDLLDIDKTQWLDLNFPSQRLDFDNTLQSHFSFTSYRMYLIL